MPKYNTLEETADILRCHKEQVRGFILSGELDAVPMGNGTKRRRWLVSDDAIKAFTDRRIAAIKSPKTSRPRMSPKKTFI